ncbi:hypothetical protein ABIB38_004308 [Massilia sp. UYP11]|uniref:hypothetical protein n=1 Tax=Massilia sp. UYP11 TaxID=1756385 RepID=UPI003D23E102
MTKNEKATNIGYTQPIATGKTLTLLMPDHSTLNDEEIDDIKEFFNLIMRKMDRQRERNKPAECVFKTVFDPNILNSVETDTPEQAQLKENLMHLFYQYEYQKKHLGQEHMPFASDEYQQVITVDNSGSRGEQDGHTK